jgi:hypothetical protein
MSRLDKILSYMKSHKTAYLRHTCNYSQACGVWSYCEKSYIIDKGNVVFRLHIGTRNRLGKYLKVVKRISDSEIILKLKKTFEGVKDDARNRQQGFV